MSLASRELQFYIIGGDIISLAMARNADILEKWNSFSRDLDSTSQEYNGHNSTHHRSYSAQLYRNSGCETMWVKTGPWGSFIIAINEKCLCHNLTTNQAMAILESRQHVCSIKTKASHLEKWVAFIVRQQAALTAQDAFIPSGNAATVVSDKTSDILIKVKALKET